MRQDYVFEASTRGSRTAGPGAGYFFSAIGNLPKGFYVARFQIVLPDMVERDGKITLEALSWRNKKDEFLAHNERPWDKSLHAAWGGLLLFVPLIQDSEVEFRCYASRDVGSLHVGALKVKRADVGRLEDWT